MPGQNLVKVGAIFLLLMVGILIGFAWLQIDFRDDLQSDAFVKLSILLTTVTLLVLTASYVFTRRWSQRTKLLEQFVAALPTAQTVLPDGGPAELESLGRAMKNMSERVRQVVDRANMESSRRETILACMAEGVLAVDEHLRVIFCNDAFAEAFGTRTPLAEGRTLYEVVREPVLRDILARVALSGTMEKDRFQLPSAAGRWFEARALPIGHEPKRGALIVLHDITDIQHQEQVRKDFVADVSHELRTPLAAIRGYAETLLDGAIDDADNNRKFLEIIQAHAVRLNNIASDLLVLSELDTQVQAGVAAEPIPLREVIESAVRTVENAAAARGVNLDWENCEDCSVVGYRFRLEQVLVNLLDNAVKFNRPDGQITVECRQAESERVCITVSDTGMGIPQQDLKRIFERFYRVDKARSRPAGGTGLGLPIVKEVVTGMGGSVSVESQLGRGSKFTILLQAA